MSQDNVAIAQSIYAAWERGDFRETDWADPQIEFEAIGDTPNPGSWKGLAGMADGWRAWLNVWEGFRVQAEDYRELDDQRVLVLTRFRGRGKTSGVEVGQLWTKGASLLQFQGGKVTRLVVYTDHERALADVGLA